MTASLLLVAILGAAPAAPVAPVDTVRGPIRASLALGPRGSPDSWTHDVGHVVAGVIAAPAIYGWLREGGASKPQARWITAGAIVAAALVKEWHDQRAVDSFSGRDIGITLVGGAAGLWLAERIRWKEND